MSDDIYYVTTPIYYPNDVPHLGHAYTTVAADVICRFRRLQGRRVHFLTGTDEHGLKLLQTAQAKGLSPKQWGDQLVPQWIEVWKALDISNDDFIRTTEARHERRVADFVQSLHDRGELYLGTYEGLYCVGCEEFKQPDDLVDGKCPLHGTVPEPVSEDNYFFRLSKYAEPLIDLYENRPNFVMPEARRNEVLGKVKQGLDDLSISRTSFDWGVPVPWDPKHVIYVWIDALLNYITAAGFGADEQMFSRLWPADVQLIGKDILWFHSVIWPAMLMALDLPLPRTVFAHGFLRIGGEKMSKSKLTGISPHDVVSTFGSDGYRYYFMREISFGLDGEFSWEGMVARYNSDLANDLGNLVSRVLNMFDRYLDGRVPEVPKASEHTPAESGLHDAFERALRGMTGAFDELALHEGLKAAWSFVRKANSYVEEVAPWTLAKSGDHRRLEVVLYELADALRMIALLVAPVTPRAADEIWRRLGLNGTVQGRSYESDGRFGLLPAGATVEVGAPLFPRLEEPSDGGA
jgi:methionyl-tRNA synthetase